MDPSNCRNSGAAQLAHKEAAIRTLTSLLARGRDLLHFWNLEAKRFSLSGNWGLQSYRGFVAR